MIVVSPSMCVCVFEYFLLLLFSQPYNNRFAIASTWTAATPQPRVCCYLLSSLFWCFKVPPDSNGTITSGWMERGRFFLFVVAAVVALAVPQR